MTRPLTVIARAWSRLHVAALFVLLAGIQLAAATDVPTPHPVYHFLQRMEARGFLKQPLSQALPYSREEIRSYLRDVHNRAQDLSAVELKQVERFQAQFGDSAAADVEDGNAFDFHIRRSGYDLVTLAGRDWSVYGNPVFESRQELHQFTGDSTGQMFVWASGFDVRGALKRFSFSVRATDAHVRGDARLADRIHFPYRYDVRSSGFDYDEADASVAYEGPHVQVLFGKTRNRWGSGQFNPLFLSDEPTSYTQFRGKFTLGPVELTALQAKLQQRPVVIVHSDTTAQGVARKEYAEKFLAAHRLQANVTHRLQIGIYEAVVYGERGFDLDYLNPVMFLRSAEHYTDDRDNALLGLDVKWRPLKGVITYGELLIDDVSTTRLGSGFYGNKLGYQGGVQWYDPAGIRNTRLTCEYARVEPYVYTHKFAINSYQHYGTMLGAPIGPNSDALNAALAWTISQPVEVELWSELRRHGANPATGRNVGGDFQRPWGTGDSQTVRFLDGDPITACTVGLKGRVEALRGIYLAATLSTTMTRTRFESGRSKSESHSEVSAELNWNPW